VHVLGVVCFCVQPLWNVAAHSCQSGTEGVLCSYARISEMNRPGRTAGLQAAAVHYVLLMNLRRFAKSYQVPDLRVENRNGFAPYFRYTAALHHLYCFGGWGIFLFERVTYLIEEHANSVPEVWKRSNNQLQKRPTSQHLHTPKPIRAACLSSLR
jgi:hypothetical protein